MFSHARLASLVLLLGCFGFSVFPQEAAKEDLAQLQGLWTVVSAERDGQPLDRLKGNTLLVKDQQFTIKTQTIVLKGTIQIDASKKPKTMDWMHEEDALKDKSWQAIYQLDGDDLKVCYTDADSEKDRPRDFETSQGSAQQLVVLKREKK